jgi:hypothetical protein
VFEIGQLLSKLKVKIWLRNKHPFFAFGQKREMFDQKFAQIKRSNIHLVTIALNLAENNLTV